MEGLLRMLQGFGVGRLAAILGGAAGVAAVLAAIFLKVGAPSTALLYSNLDPKEASQVVAALDQAGIKHEEKGDGTTIMVDRDKVNAARLMVVDRATGETFVGRVPPYSVVVAGSLPGKPLPNGQPGPSLYCAVIVKRVDEQTRSKTSINDLLRD